MKKAPFEMLKNPAGELYSLKQTSRKTNKFEQSEQKRAAPFTGCEVPFCRG
jgi:hypothetical protein